MKCRILLAPLDWGLGHATRIIPIIRELELQGAEVVVGASGQTRLLLEQEFPLLEHVEIPGYDIGYSKNRWTMAFTMAAQVPKIIAAIDDENEMLDELVKTLRLDAVISDNRYGLYDDKIPSVFLGHQLLIRTGMGKTADQYLQKINYSFINKFSECWIPDYENGSGLAGLLSHPTILPSIPVKYLGPLSRFSAGHSESGKHILIMLSGPEPQRTLLETLVLEQSNQTKEKIVLVRGLPGGGPSIDAPAHMEVFDHLPARLLEEKILEASMVIARSGYSTVMDLAVMNKPAILVPTPGQTEQEYLAQHLMQQQLAFHLPQDKFRLAPALDLARHFPFKKYDFQGENNLSDIINQFLNQLKPGGI
ncbi:MAG: glycosyltransferase [Flavisolibacter sp.]